MLLLTRRIGEEIIINGNVVVTICGVKGNQVRVGIQAPESVEIHRREVYERILNEEAEADQEPGPENQEQEQEEETW